ncbi:helix-turn-helix transcriptional regulator [Cryptosporangium phraense]|uniref:AAA family ATPase n=1 Tax=Cryptosporangium phraense TaxID=2593070 RepID=A0A545AH76_9ACTN|nr:helix-turn-helix transcriptional regulator [Cryptosporangium phraense]TQS40671.1 AAA family ATPase [Cryptosporangium phraense]
MERGLVSSVLVGRRAELARLRALLERVTAGQPAVAVLSGEAGVGKSRLVAEVAREAADDFGVRVLRGRCVDLGGAGLALAPLVDVLRTLSRTSTPDELDRLLGPARRELARLLPELGPTAGTSAEDPTSRLLEQVLGLITRLAADQPLLLVVEDLHWADRSTRDLVSFLAQTLQELGVMLLMTYRSDELHRRHPLRPLVTGWERMRSVERLEVGRFTRREVDEQLRAIRGRRSNAAFLDVVFERSQGNAFLVEEILAAVEGGADPSALPPSLRDVLLARTETVSEAAQSVLRVAAAAGPRISERLLAAVSGTGPAELHPALREAVEHHLLVIDSSGHGYEFRHELTRDALYDDMLPGERVRLHAAYGEALSGDATLLGEDSGSIAATLAHHWYAALDLPRALSASVRAGQHAAARYAPAEALHHFERVLQLWPRVGDAVERAGIDWTDANLAAIDAAFYAGELQRGLSLVDEVLADPASVADPVRRARVAERRAHLLGHGGRTEEAAAQLREALALLPERPVTVTHAAVLASLATMVRRSGDEEGAQAIARRAAAAAAESGATAYEAESLITLGSATGYLDDVPAGLATLHQGIDLARAHQYDNTALRGYINLSDLLEMIGRHAEATQAARDGLALSGRVGSARSWGAMLAGNIVEPLLRLGRWREAQDLITETLADDPVSMFAASLFLLRAELHLWQGDRAAAAADRQEAGRHLGGNEEVQYSVPLAYLDGELARSAGDLEAAWDHVRPALRPPIVPMAVRYCWPLAWLGARVHADARPGAVGDPGDVDALRTLIETLPATTPPARAAAAMARAELARAGGRGEVGAWQAAVTACREASELFPLCYGLFRLAEARAATALDTGAAADAQECLRYADDLAAATAQDVRALVRRARIRLEQPDGPVPDVENEFKLTDREREVLGLVAEGRSNGQIAGVLYISPKTASVHVSNILAKLGVGSRTEATTMAHRHGLLPA